MNQQTFLNELKKHLRVLEDGEIKDILDEYSQHIQMKIEKGQSEAEAIADFGPIDELAAQILSAYHVKPGNERSRFSEDLSDAVDNIVQEGQKMYQSGSDFVKDKAPEVKNLFKRSLDCCVRVCKRLIQLCALPFVWFTAKCNAFTVRMSEKRAADTDPASPETQYGVSAKSRHAGGIFTGIWHMCTAFLKACLDACICLTKFCVRIFLVLLRWCWNICTLGMGLFFGFFALLFLFSFGMTAILLPEGYPLLGLTLILLGCFLGGIACAIFFCSLIVRKSEKSAVNIAKVQNTMPHPAYNVQQVKQNESETPGIEQTTVSDADAELHVQEGTVEVEHA